MTRTFDSLTPSSGRTVQPINQIGIFLESSFHWLSIDV